MSSWVPRDTAPSPGDPYYTSTQQSTYTPALNPYPDVSAAGFVLPNCTGLAAGRQIEQGYGEYIKPSNGFGNAQTWWDASVSFCDRGQDPQLGAIAVWSGGGYWPPAGHVGTVEYYDPATDTITTSNSDYSGRVFYTLTLSGHNPSIGSSYTFLGYIYPAGNPKPSWFYPVLCKKRRKKYGRSRIKRRTV